MGGVVGDEVVGGTVVTGRVSTVVGGIVASVEGTVTVVAGGVLEDGAVCRLDSGGVAPGVG